MKFCDFLIALFIAAALASPESAVAGPVGLLEVQYLTTPAANISASGILWVSSSHCAQSDCARLNAATNVTSSFGTLTDQSPPGHLSDITFPLFPETIFTFDSSLLDFRLNSLSSSISAPTNGSNCIGLSAGQSCQVAGFPFWLTKVSFDTEFLLSASGTVADTSGLSTWVGTLVFSVPADPFGLAAELADGGGVNADAFFGSAQITAVPTPEPATFFSMVFLAPAVLATLVRRRGRPGGRLDRREHRSGVAGL